jgi:hypothetical protein
MFRRIRRALSIILLLISIALVIWASLPNKHHTVVQNISPEEMQISSTVKGGDPLSMRVRQVVLVWPDSMRIGDDETITLVFEPVVTDSVSFDHPAGYSNVYSLYNLMAEARYDVSGLSLTPANPTRESMPGGQPVKFTWKVNTDQVGSYNGTVWLSLRYLPLDGGLASQIPIYIQEVSIQASSLLGLNETMAYLLGGVGVVLAAVIVYDDLITWVLKRRIKKTTTSKCSRMQAKDTMDTKDIL